MVSWEELLGISDTSAMTDSGKKALEREDEIFEMAAVNIYGKVNIIVEANKRNMFFRDEAAYIMAALEAADEYMETRELNNIDEVFTREIAGEMYRGMTVQVEHAGQLVNQMVLARKTGKRMVTISISYSGVSEDEIEELLNCFAPYE